MRKDNSTSTCLFSVKVYGKSVPCDRVQLVIGTVGDVRQHGTTTSPEDTQ